MPTISITKTYLNGNILTQSDLDSAFNSISTFLNTTKIDNSNIQTGGILGTNLANGTIGTSQLGAGSVGSAQIASSAVTTTAIGPLAVAQAQIALAAVGPLQKAALGQQVSGASGSFTVSGGTFTDVTNLSVSITTNGRPVFLAVQADGSNQFSVGGTGTASGGAILNFLRSGSQIAEYFSEAVVGGGGAVVHLQNSYFHIDTPAAGTYTYKVQAKASGGATANVTNAVLMAFEL